MTLRLAQAMPACCTCFEIASSERSEGPRQRTILYMGSQIELPEGEHKLLAQRIGDIIADQKSLLPYSVEVELLAQAYASQVIRRLSSSKDSAKCHENEDVEPQFVNININSIEKYDLTNTYMEGQAKSNPKATHGVSKEKRNDCPLVTMGLVMNEHGFLNRTSILTGYASEPKTLEKMIENLNAHQNLFKPTIILDAGIATIENLAWLRKNEYTYVVSARQDAPFIDLEGELVSVGHLNNLVKAALIKSESENKKIYHINSKCSHEFANSPREITELGIRFKSIINLGFASL